MGVSKYNRNLVNRAQDDTFISQPLSLSLSLSLSLKQTRPIRIIFYSLGRVVQVIRSKNEVETDRQKLGDAESGQWLWHSWQSSCFQHQRTRVQI